MSDLKSATLKQGAGKLLLKDKKIQTALPKIPKFGHLNSNFEKRKVVENCRFTQF